MEEPAMKKTTTYVGLDVHSSSIAIVALPEGAERAKVSEIPSEPKAIRRAFTRLQAEFGTLRCCYEAGPCGFALYRQLTELRIHCVVVAPALIPQRAGDRVKTDRRDATKLARLYRAGELTAIRVPTPAEEAVRDLVRAREDVRKDLIAARHRLSKFLLRQGRIYSEGKKWTDRFWRWLRTQTFEHPAERFTFEHYVL
jgi:transposase